MYAHAIASTLKRGILAGSLSVMAANFASAQLAGSQLVPSASGSAAAESPRTPPLRRDQGLRTKEDLPPIRSEVTAEQRGDIFMARKMYRAAADSYQEELATVTERRAGLLRAYAASLRESSREGEARTAETQAKQQEKKASELKEKQQYLPGSASGFFSRLLAALGIGGRSPSVPEGGNRPAASAPVSAELAAAVAMPEGLSPREQAAFLAQHRRHEEAAGIYDNLIHQDQRKQAVLWNKIGISYHQMLDFPAAARCYRESSSVDPLYAEARNNLGTVYHAQKQFSRAIGEYKKALAVTPYSASVHGNLGTAYLASKDYEQASIHYAKAIELDPMIFERQGGQGTILQERGVDDRASLHFYLSKVYARKGDLERSLLYMRKALEEGFKDRKKFVEDEDFAALQAVPEFQTLLATEFRVL